MSGSMSNELLVMLSTVDCCKHTLPISLIKTIAETECATTDKVLIVYAAFSNLQLP